MLPISVYKPFYPMDYGYPLSTSQRLWRKHIKGSANDLWEYTTKVTCPALERACTENYIYYNIREGAFLYAYHIALWDWQAKTGHSVKGEWPGWAKIGHKAINKCFACECAWAIGKARGKKHIECCEFCPIEWPDKDLCTAQNSPYEHWRNAIKEEERAFYALQVLALPLNSNFKGHVLL